MTSDRQISELEARVDAFFSKLELRHYPRNLAQWVVLTRSALEVQRASAPEYGSQKHKNATLTYSRIAALLLDQIARFGTHRYASKNSLLWGGQFSSVSYQALREGAGYFTANSYFPAWHQGRATATVLGSQIRFVSSESSKQRQFHAFQKGIFPKANRRPSTSDQLLLTPSAIQQFQQVLSSCGGLKSGKLTYRVPKSLYFEILAWFQDRNAKQVRWPDETNLGRYTISQIKAFWSALQTVCAVHDYICFVIGLHHEFPANSAVLRKRVSEWISELTLLSELAPDTLGTIIDDLTFGDRSPVDLHLELFVRLTQDGHVRGLLPHFVLSTRMDENLLRTLARTDQDLYNKISTTKEQELVRDAAQAFGGKFVVSGPFELPKEAQTNLDLVVADESTSTVLLAELKWIRKPAFIKERIRADGEFLQGFKQLRKVRSFVYANPSYLRRRGAIKKDLHEYSNVHFGLVGVDHLAWSEPDSDQFVVEYDVLKKCLLETKDLNAAILHLREYAWLPCEGTDFEIRFESTTVNGVSIEGESFFVL